jgi:hypothetical protein
VGGGGHAPVRPLVDDASNYGTLCVLGAEARKPSEAEPRDVPSPIGRVAGASHSQAADRRKTVLHYRRNVSGGYSFWPPHCSTLRSSDMVPLSMRYKPRASGRIEPRATGSPL